MNVGITDIMLERIVLKMLNKGMLTSNTCEWATPQWLFDELHKEFNFELDVCANESNHKCSKYFDVNLNGLEQDWTGICYMNPPYGRQIGKWVEKAYKSVMRGGQQ